jgi:hypothetical protein
MKRKWTYKGEDITWVIDQVTKVFRLLSLHLATKKRPFPNEQELDVIFDAAKDKVKEEYNGD